MPRFTVRIELHDAESDDYATLHEKMETEGFSDLLSTTNGSVRMPPAEYNYEGVATKEDVLRKAKTAASQVVKKYAVLVTESAGRTCYGLEPV